MRSAKKQCFDCKKLPGGLTFQLLESDHNCDVKCMYRVVKKTAQSLWHHNFATVHHRVMRFLAKCSERNSLHD